MRKIWVLFLVFAGLGPAFAQQPVFLDQAIENSAYNLAQELRDSTMVVLNFTSPTPELSEYVIEELTAQLGKTGNVTMVSREKRNLALLDEELEFQMSEVAETRALAIGEKLEAQYIITGSFSTIGKSYLIRIRAINVKTAGEVPKPAITIQLDATLAALLHIVTPDFSTGKRISTGFLNIAFGTGSFIMGDWLGGSVCAVGYAAALGLIIWDVVGFSYDDAMAGIPGSVGFGIAGATLIFGFVRPFFFHRPGAFDGMNIALIPDHSGITAVKVSYTIKF
jgi:TolB-like protein